jgi:hypothetical protein
MVWSRVLVLILLSLFPLWRLDCHISPLVGLGAGVGMWYVSFCPLFLSSSPPLHHHSCRLYMGFLSFDWTSKYRPLPPASPPHPPSSTSLLTRNTLTSVHLAPRTVPHHWKLFRCSRPHPSIWNHPQARSHPQLARFDPKPSIQLSRWAMVVYPEYSGLHQNVSQRTRHLTRFRQASIPRG